ncbi:hypothetical protein JHK85_002023 [Glycine max]|nr:hypothetical protein JHK85_002023 [Glycine max]
MFHVSTVVLNPQPHTFLFPLPFFTSRNLQLSQTLQFPRNWNLRSISPSLHPTPQYDDSEDHVIGDCVVFEDGVFDEPLFHNHHHNPDNLTVDKPKPRPKPRPRPSWRKKVEETLGENLVPDKWREVQAEINITKREMRKIAREVEFNSKVEKKRRGLIPLRDMNLDDYKAYKEAKLAQMKLLDYSSSFPVDENVPEPELNRGEKFEAEAELDGGERVAPKNPRWAVYGRGLEDVTEFFNSDNYDPTAKIPGGRRKLFNKEEKVLLNKRIPDLAAATSDKWLPLHTLAACGEFYLLDSLLKHNVDINAVDKDGLTALHRATIGKKQAIINYLLRNSANPFVQDNEGATLMHYAVLTASTQTIKILLLYNVDINLQDNYGWTPLHLAVQAQRTDLVRLLLIKGADKTLKNEDGLTPLDLCLYNGQSARTYELIKLFKQPQRRFSHVSINPLVLKNPSTFHVKAKLPEPDFNGERVEPKDPRGFLHGKGLEDVMQFFIVGAITLVLRPLIKGKWLPQHTVAACGELYLLDSWLKHNADINSVDKDGLTALHKAIGKKQVITNFLLKNSANVFVRDKFPNVCANQVVKAASRVSLTNGVVSSSQTFGNVAVSFLLYQEQNKGYGQLSLNSMAREFDMHFWKPYWQCKSTE